VSTRSSVVLVTDGDTVMHLYHEMLDDDAVHLEIDLDKTHIVLNVVIPKPLVDGVAAILKRAERAARILPSPR
jgi:hypothetical protein